MVRGRDTGEIAKATPNVWCVVANRQTRGCGEPHVDACATEATTCIRGRRDLLRSCLVDVWRNRSAHVLS